MGRPKRGVTAAHLAQVVRERRSALGLTGAELAEWLGVSRQAIGHIERTGRMDLDKYPILAAALSVPLQSIFPPGWRF